MVQEKFKRVLIAALCAVLPAIAPSAQTKGQENSGPGTVKYARQASRKADASSYFQGNLYGAIVSDASWTNGSHVGLYQIDADLTTTLLLENVEMTGAASVFINGKYYVTKYMAYGTWVASNVMDVYDTESRQFVARYSMPAQAASIAIGLAYDRMADQAYAITYNATMSGYVLNKFDYMTRTYTEIGNLSETFFTLTFDADGHLYGINKDGVLKTISTEDASTEEVLSTGLTPNYVQSAVWNPRDEAIIWMATLSDNTGQLVKLDPANGTWEKLTDIYMEVMGLYTTDAIAKDGAPEQPVDAAIAYDAPGTNEATVSFTMPTATVGGDHLTGELTVTIKVDGSEEHVLTATATAGDTFSQTVDLGSEGVHKLTVYVGNEAGNSQPVILSAFGGFDTPSAVGGLGYTLTDDGLLTLSWDASTAIHDGYIGTVTYHIARNGEEIATTEDTSFEETIGGPLMLYGYTVTPEANGISGETAATERFPFGDALDLPYSQDFSDPDAFLLFRTIDANADGNTWQLQSWSHIVMYQRNENQADDYLLTPKFKVQAGHAYAISFDTYLDYQSEPEELSVLIADGNTLEAMEAGEVLLDKETISNTSQAKRRIEVICTSDTDGERVFAFHITSQPQCWKLNITNILIEDKGNVQAPKAIADLTVTPHDNGVLRADVDFSAPQVNFSDEPISTIDRIDLMRNGEVVKTFDDVTPGEHLSYTDEVEAPAFYDYAVIPYNVYGAGDRASARAYVGGYHVPTSFLDDTKESDFAFFANQDVNADGNGWTWNEEEQCAQYVQLETGYANDYLYSPMVYMEAGKVYEIRCDAHVNEGSTGFVLFTRLSSDMTPQTVQTYYPAQVVRSTDEFETISKFIQVAADGFYSITLSADGWLTEGSAIFIKNITVSEGPDAGTPAAVADVKATAAEEGELKATLTFKMPQYDILGNYMGYDTQLGVKVYNRDGDLCGELPQEYHPNDDIEMEVEALQGMNTFWVYATNDKGQGDRNFANAYCGIDVPLRVNDLTSWPLEDNQGTVLKWEAPTEGTHMGYITNDDVTYHIFLIDDDGTETEIATTEDTQYTYQVDNDELRKYTFGVLPSTTFGMGTQIWKVFNQLGTPYRLPFVETFAGGTCATSPWIGDEYLGTTRWDVVTETDNIQSDDNGFLYYHDIYNRVSVADLLLPKISLKGIEKGILEVTTWQYYQAHAMFEVLVSDDDNNRTSIGYAYCENVAEFGQTGWQTWTFDLSPFADAQWLQIILHGTIDNDFYAAIDDIRIYDNEPTAITNVKREGDQQPIFNLQGQRLSAPVKGIVIQNGRKIVSR